jgi:gas vesicle protein
MNRFTNDDILSSLGLRQRTPSSDITDTILPALAVFGTGLLVGAGAALLLAPKPGRELRNDLAAQAGQLKDTVQDKMPALPNWNGTESNHAGSSTSPTTTTNVRANNGIA